MARTLFLLGGSAAYDAVAEPFVTLAGGPDGSIALLLQGPGSERYVPEITAPWARRGVSRFRPIMPERNLPDDEVAALVAYLEAIGADPSG